jgi:hypothetical protein
VIVASAPDPVVPGSDLNIFIAIPMGSLNNASFTSDYQTAVLDFSGEIKNAFFTLSPDGKGGLGTITLNGQETNAPGFVAVKVTQSVSGASYSFNGDGSATLTVPANPLFTGTKTMFASPDGNFILGWTPGRVGHFLRREGAGRRDGNEQHQPRPIFYGGIRCCWNASKAAVGFAGFLLRDL